MFGLVSQAKYDELENKYSKLMDLHNAQVSKWNDVVRQINEKGGEAFLKHGKIHDVPNTQNQFSDDDLRSLLQLVHPDKHCGKQSAVQMTQKINKLRGK